MGASGRQALPSSGLKSRRRRPEVGRRRRAAAVGARGTAARVLRWVLGKEERSVSYARMRRRRARVAGRRCGQARRSSVGRRRCSGGLGLGAGERVSGI